MDSPYIGMRKKIQKIQWLMNALLLHSTFYFSHLISKMRKHFSSIEKILRKVRDVITLKQFPNRRVSEDEGYLI